MNPINSFRPGQLWLDNNNIHINAHGGGLLFYGGLYYWFGEHKIEGSAGNAAHVGVHVYSSTDLIHWTDRGIALRVSDEPGHPIERGCVLERPKVIYNPRTNKFVMWFHLELKGQGYHAAKVGVATSDNPVGPFAFVRAFRPNACQWPMNVPDAWKSTLSPDDADAQIKAHPSRHPAREHPIDIFFRRDFAGGQMSRDMTLFVDEDGSAYHITASEENSTLHISKLTDDFLDTTGQYVRVFSGRYHEAPAICKRRGKYYMISSNCTGWDPNPARSAVADHIMGPWTELGNPCIGTSEQIETTFGGQATYIQPVYGQEDAYIFLADIWRPKNAIDGRYLWLPLEFTDNRPCMRWHDQWDLSVFDRMA